MTDINCDNYINTGTQQTKDVRREVYWAVAELVKNRLDKARIVREI